MGYKKKYAVVKSSPRLNSVVIDNKTMTFGEKATGFVVSDKGLADEIEARHEKHGDVVVIPQGVIDPGHHWTFTVPELPWKREKHNG